MKKVMSLDEIRALVGKRVSEHEAAGGGEGDSPDFDFVLRCLYRNELGDGELFKKRLRDDFVFNKSMDSWLYWKGHN